MAGGRWRAAPIAAYSYDMHCCVSNVNKVLEGNECILLAKYLFAKNLPALRHEPPQSSRTSSLPRTSSAVTNLLFVTNFLFVKN